MVQERELSITRAGEVLSLEPRVFRVLTFLLRNPKRLVTKEELLDAVWNDCTVSENAHARSVARLRQVLGDNTRQPRYIATVHTVGYRFLCDVEVSEEEALPAAFPTNSRSPAASTLPLASPRRRIYFVAALFVVVAVLGTIAALRQTRSPPTTQRKLSRLTFHDGLETGASWSPDGRFFAYSSDRSGKSEIWVQQLSGGDAVQITSGPGSNWQPDWSPDGKLIAFRSERSEGGIYATPPLGGKGEERKLSSFGFHPRWSRDSAQVLFQTTPGPGRNRLFVVGTDGSEPREVLADFILAHGDNVISSVWHPDGRRISVWSDGSSPAPEVWTVALGGSPAIRTLIPPELVRQLKTVSAGTDPRQWNEDGSFSWSPTADAIYFERTFGGAKTLWRLTVDSSLRGTGLERLTTGPGLNSDLALSPDGSRLLFTVGSRNIRSWLFPFDPLQGRLMGEGTPVTSVSVEAWNTDLSHDGKQLVFNGRPGGTQQLFQKLLPDGDEAPLRSDAYERGYPEWSPDGHKLAYFRRNRSTAMYELVLWTTDSQDEQPLTSPSKHRAVACGWSPDGTSVLGVQNNKDIGRTELWILPVSAAPHAEAAAQKLASSPAYDVYQGQFSPDGRWVAFEGTANHADGNESSLFVIPSEGGPWRRLTDGKHWDDKPRWSPDGRTLFFLSGRDGFFDVRGLPFDPKKGEPRGSSYQVTRFNHPNLMVPPTSPESACRSPPTSF